MLQGFRYVDDQCTCADCRTQTSQSSFCPFEKIEGWWGEDTDQREPLQVSVNEYESWHHAGRSALHSYLIPQYRKGSKVTNWQPNQWHQHFQFTTFVTSKAQSFLAPGVSRLRMLPECRADRVPHSGVSKWFWTPCGIWALSTFRYAHSSHHSFLFNVFSVCTDIRLPHPNDKPGIHK